MGASAYSINTTSRLRQYENIAGKQMKMTGATTGFYYPTGGTVATTSGNETIAFEYQGGNPNKVDYSNAAALSDFNLFRNLPMNPAYANFRIRQPSARS